MAKAQAHFRLDPELLEAIKVRAESEKITVTDLVTRFLMQGLGLDTHSDIQNVNQKEIEESVYQSVSERIAHELNELENRILERVAVSISSLNNNWEKRISECITKPKVNVEKTVDIQDEQRVSDENKTYNSEKSGTKRISSSVSPVSTEKLEEVQARNKTLTLFNTTLNEQVLKPGKLAILLNDKTNSKDWSIHKLKNLRLRQLTWIKNYRNSDKKAKREPTLPLIVEKYLIDWVISDSDDEKSTGKEWWIKELPSNKDEAEALIQERKAKYIQHYFSNIV